MSFLNAINQDADRLAREIPFNRFDFLRQMIVVRSLRKSGSLKIVFRQFWLNMNALQKTLILSKRVELFVETADTNEAKELSTFYRKFTVPLRQALKKKGWIYKANRMQSAVRFFALFFHAAELLLCGVFLSW